MKKLLVLFLVFAMAPLASATLQPTLDGTAVDLIPGDTVDGIGVELGLFTDSGIQYYDVTFEIVSGDLAFDTSEIAFPAVFTFVGKIVEETATSLRVGASQFMAPDVGPAQLVTGIGISGTGVIEMFDSYNPATPVSLGCLNVVPEPMTIALLGLGGLFLRRRRS